MDEPMTPQLRPQRSSNGNGLLFTLFALVLVFVGGCTCDPLSSGVPVPPSPPTSEEPTDGDAAPPADDPQSDQPKPPASELACVGCHNAAAREGPVVVNAAGTGGHSLSSGAASNAECELCHEMTRHREGRVRLWTSPVATPSPVIVLVDDPARVPAEAAKLVPLCTACHGVAYDTGRAVHGNWGLGCTQCHDVHDPDNDNLALVAASVYDRTLDVVKPVVFTARKGANSFSDGDPAANDGICQVCHTATRFHTHDGGGTPHEDGTTCTDCHAHAEGFVATSGSCITCHGRALDNGDNVPPGGRPAVVHADGSGGHQLQADRLSDEDCLTCHEMTQHQRGQIRLWLDPTNPADVLAAGSDAAELTPFCQACHGDSDDPAIHTTGGPWEPACTECHAIHDPNNQNRSLVSDLVYNRMLDVEKPVVFTARSGANSFDDGEPASNDGVCQVCHTATHYHTHDGSATPHNDASTCTVCHPHKAGFQPIGGTCVGCHAQAWDNGDNVPPGGRRAVIPDGSNPADFGNVSHHVQGPVRDQDCTVCHHMSRHQRGHVRLKDPDDDNIIYTYDEATPDELESFCRHCHDADGAAAGGGVRPFSDGQTVPDIERGGLWSASAHATGGTSNSGYVCTDCHGNGHGSNLRKLLLPWDGVPGPDNVNEEEGFCYGCHAGGGVINEAISNGWFDGSYENFGDNVEAAFGLHAAHPVNDSAAGHEFDIGNGPQELECTSCHGVHQSTGKYWEAVAGHTPVNLFGTGELWGDAADEKIGNYDSSKVFQPPFLGEPGVDLSGNALPIDGEGNSLLTDTVLPDYNTLCLTCHQHAVGDLEAIDWSSKKHGSAEAEPEGPAGSPLAEPYDTASRGAYFLGCLDCHEAHASENVWMIKRSVNGATVPDILTDGSTAEWFGFCDQCHVRHPRQRHHNADVWRDKLGMESPECERCHDPLPFVNCTTAGCHNHGGFF